MITYNVSVPAQSNVNILDSIVYEGSHNLIVRLVHNNSFVTLSNDGTTSGLLLTTTQSGVGYATDSRATAQFNVSDNEPVYAINNSNTALTVSVLLSPNPSSKVNLCISPCEGN